MYVLDGSILPDAPNLLTLGEYGDENKETILYTGKSGNTITGITRAVEGTQATFPVDTRVTRSFTAKDLNDLQDNQEQLLPTTGDAKDLTISTLATDTSKEIIAGLKLPQYVKRLENAIGDRVIIEDGKGLYPTTGAVYTTGEKTKLEGVEANANNYTLPSTLPATMITEDIDHNFVTTAQKTKIGQAVYPSPVLVSIPASSWNSSGVATVTIENIAADTLLSWAVPIGRTSEQFAALAAAQLSVTGQGTNSVSITAEGDAPAIAVSILFTVWRT